MRRGRRRSESTEDTTSPGGSPPSRSPPPAERVRLIVNLKLLSGGGLFLSILGETGLGKQLNDFLDTPLGRSFATIFFLWFALSGWLFRFLIFATWVLPFAGPLLIGAVANNLVIKGECPACRKQFVGYKNQTVRCASCGNIVWQPQGDFFSKGGKGPSSSSKSQPDIIDVEFEEK